MDELKNSSLFVEGSVSVTSSLPLTDASLALPPLPSPARAHPASLFVPVEGRLYALLPPGQEGGTSRETHKSESLRYFGGSQGLRPPDGN